MSKGSSLVIIALSVLCALAAVHAQTDDKPVVISASRVPVLGGTVQIYGRNFGSDASAISVEIEDLISGGTVACINVQIKTPNRVISCYVASAGTGKSMHITVSVTHSTDGGASTISNDEDNNVAFSREVPQLNALVYSVENKTIVVKGSNFGYDPSKVTVLLAGDDYPVLAVDNNNITLRFLRKRRADGYEIPDTSLAHVTVDGLTNVANMTTSRAALVSEEAEDIYSSEASQGKGTSKGTVAGLAAGGAFILVAVSVFIAAFVMKRNKKDNFKQDNFKKDVAPSSPTKPETGRLSHETGRALQFALINGQQPEKDGATDHEMRLPPFLPPNDAVEKKDATVQEKDATIPERAKVYAAEEGKAGEANDGVHSDDEHHSLEEIDLHDNVYEENDPRMSDSSFSESSDDESEHVDNTSSFSEDFSDASPANSPAGDKRKQLQMSSEYPSSPYMGRRPSLQLAPSPPMLLSTREPLPASSLRHSMIPPDLSLDYADSDGSPLPTPRNVSRNTKEGKKKKTKKGMIRVPSSRLASRISMPKNVMDSPQL